MRRYHARNGKIYMINERFDYTIGPNGHLMLKCVLSADEEGKQGSPMVFEVSENEVPELVEEHPEMTEEKKKSVLLGLAVGRLEQELDQLR